MPKSENQKLKLLYLMKIFYDYSDEQHPLTVADLIRRLSAYGISAERKSIYSDIELLKDFGMDIETVEGRSHGHYVCSRDFEIPELKLLVDVVQSSNFITQKKSRELIKKLEGFCSKYQAGNLDRQVYVANRIKSMNESIYYAVDYIHTAISTNSQISFNYYEWTSKKEKRLKRNGAAYTVSPWALTWDNENYYLVAFDSTDKKLKHFRVDKISNVSILEEKREGQADFSTLDMGIYSKSVFGMFGGNPGYVTLLCHESIAGVIIDRFGVDTVFRKSDESHFEIDVNVVLSPQFYSWVFGLGNKISIVSPSAAKDGFLKMLGEVCDRYK